MVPSVFLGDLVKCIQWRYSGGSFSWFTLTQNKYHTLLPCTCCRLVHQWRFDWKCVCESFGCLAFFSREKTWWERATGGFLTKESLFTQSSYWPMGSRYEMRASNWRPWSRLNTNCRKRVQWELFWCCTKLKNSWAAPGFCGGDFWWKILSPSHSQHPPWRVPESSWVRWLEVLWSNRNFSPWATLRRKYKGLSGSGMTLKWALWQAGTTPKKNLCVLSAGVWETS